MSDPQLTSIGMETARRWQSAWAVFWQRVAAHMLGVAREHVVDEPFEPGDSQLALAMIERLCQDIGLGQSWVVWVTEVNSALPDPEVATPSTRFPQQLPLPPEEPVGATATLLNRASRDRLEGWAASWILYHLALARAVRELRGHSPLGQVT